MKKLVFAIAFTLVLGLAAGFACSKMTMVTADGTVISGRSLDWASSDYSNVWVLPRGLAQDGKTGADTLHWTSKYGSVVVNTYDGVVLDGMNEKGLSAHLLWLTESDYGKAEGGEPTLAITMLAPYLLDNFAAVAEAVDALSALRIVTGQTMEAGVAYQMSLHLTMTDASGDIGVVEWIKGAPKIYHGKQYNVLTNSPTYDKQLKKVKNIAKLKFNKISGSPDAASRFVRLSKWVSSLDSTDSGVFVPAGGGGKVIGVSEALGAMRTISTPLGYTVPGHPEVSSTVWRTVYDHTHRIFYFDSAAYAQFFWLPFGEINFDEGQSVRKLVIATGKPVSGNAVSQLKDVPEGIHYFSTEDGTPEKMESAVEKIMSEE